MFRNRDYFDRFKGFVNTAALNKEERQLFKDLSKWYEGSEEEIDWNVFRSWFFTVAHPKMGETNSNIYNMMLDKLDEYDEPDEAFATATIEAFLTREMCGKVSEITLAGYEGERDVELSEVELVLEDYAAKLGRTHDVDQYYVNDDITDLTTSITTGGLEWRHEELNKSVGNLRQGKLVVLGARPNAGKTTWLADNVTHFASQLEDDEVAIWFNNEEAGKEVKFRIVQSGIARSAEQIRLNPVLAKADYERIVGDWHKIEVVDKSDLSVSDVEQVLKSCKKKVGLIIFDQLWKVHGFDKSQGNDATRLQVLYQWARELAKKHGPVITTHQADYTAEGVKELTMGQLHQNKTGIQGECDTIIMMGRSYDIGEEKFRYFTVAKNKGAYGPKVDNSLIEHKYVMKINHEVARYGV